MTADAHRIAVAIFLERMEPSHVAAAPNYENMRQKNLPLRRSVENLNVTLANSNNIDLTSDITTGWSVLNTWEKFMLCECPYLYLLPNYPKRENKRSFSTDDKFKLFQLYLTQCYEKIPPYPADSRQTVRYAQNFIQTLAPSGPDETNAIRDARATFVHTIWDSSDKAILINIYEDNMKKLRNSPEVNLSEEQFHAYVMVPIAKIQSAVRDLKAAKTYARNWQATEIIERIEKESRSSPYEQVQNALTAILNIDMLIKAIILKFHRVYTKAKAAPSASSRWLDFLDEPAAPAPDASDEDEAAAGETFDAGSAADADAAFGAGSAANAGSAADADEDLGDEDLGDEYWLNRGPDQTLAEGLHSP